MGSNANGSIQQRSVRDIIRIGSFITALLASSLVSAAGERTVCREEAITVKAIQKEVTALGLQQQRIEQLSAGTRPADVNIEELLGARLNNDRSVAVAFASTKNESNATQDWPESLTCKSLQAEYQESLNDLTWLREDIRKRRQIWLSIPTELRKILRTLWVSRQKLEIQYGKLSEALAEAKLDIDLNESPVGAIHAQQQILRLKILRLLPSIREDISPSEINEFLSLWQYAIDTKMVIGFFDPNEVNALPEKVQKVGREYIDMARLDALQMRYLINHIRGWLWQNAHETFIDGVSKNGGITNLLVYELHAIKFRLRELRNNISLEIATRTGSERPAIALSSLALSYLVGLAAMVLLGYIAKRIALLVIVFNEHISRSVKGRRWLSNLSRVLGGIAPLAPWIAGWYGIRLLSSAYSHYELPFLVALIPFARMYILYGVVLLVGEWMILRIAQQASVYLSSEQASLIRPSARRTAAIIVLPWLVMDLVATGIGPSLILRLCVLLSLFTLFIAIALLLNKRRSDLLVAVQSLLPPKLDPVAEKLLNERWVFLFAPLTLPILLLSFITSFIHKLLIDFDWYRKLSARWFKIRVQASEGGDDESEADDSKIAQDYGCWFVDESDDKDLPYINSGLLAATRKQLNRWLDENTEENSLLLTGERGIGKTSALSKLTASLAEDHPELKVELVHVPAKTKTPADVKKLIGDALGTDLSDGPGALVHSDTAREPTLVILDNAQNFFLSNVGGMEGWQTLLSLTNARLNNIFWLIVINNQSWAYMSNVFGRDYQFRNVLRAKRWSQNDIRSLILSRNHLSGYKIKYDEILLANRGPEAGNIRNAEQRYFSLLWDACRGNPMLALRLWMTSVHTDGKEVVVGLPEEPSSAAIEKVGGNLLFVYAAVVMHENLSSDEIVAATSLPDSVVRYALKTAFDAGFLQRSNDGRYRLVPLWYHTITNLLARKNLLHE